MMVWLSQHPAWAKARKLAISTSSFGMESSVDIYGYGNTKSVNRKVRFVAAYDYMFSLWHNRRYVRVMRSKAEGFSYHTTRSLHLR
jgi:hypothetical protein